MKFCVQRLYSKGVRLPDQHIINGPQVEGELRTREERDEVTGELTRVASLLDPVSPHTRLLPELHDVHLANISPFAITLRGFEHVMTDTGPTEVRQEWWVKSGEGLDAQRNLAVESAGAVIPPVTMPRPARRPVVESPRRFRVVQ